MNKTTPPCRQCFPHGEAPRTQSFDTTLGAMRVFGILHADGRMPVMCQGHDHRYHVCCQVVPRASSTGEASPRYSSVAA